MQTMRGGVEVSAPLLDQNLGVLQAVENFGAEEFVPEPGVNGEDGPAPEKGPYNGPTQHKKLLNETLFQKMAHARVWIRARATGFNETRPHTALDYRTPKALSRSTVVQPMLLAFCERP